MKNPMHPIFARPFRHLPPTATSIKIHDFKAGIEAFFNPNIGYSRLLLALSKVFSSEQCFLVSSGRAALFTILSSLKRKSDRTGVILPAYSCPSVVKAIIQNHLNPIFCDLEPTTLQFEQRCLDKLLQSNPLAVIPTYLYGIIHDIRALKEKCTQINVVVIEDVAQTFGATINGNYIGTIGDFGFSSFGWGKCIPTGQGGLIISQEKHKDEIKQTLDQILSYKKELGIKSLIAMLGYSIATTPNGWWFIHNSFLNPAEAGMDISKLKPIDVEPYSPVQAAFAASLIARFDIIIKQRRTTANSLNRLLSEFDYLTLPSLTANPGSVYLRFPIIVDTVERAEHLFIALNQIGIGVSKSYTRTLPDLFSSWDVQSEKKYAGAEHLAKCLLTLPTHHYYNVQDFMHIKEIFKQTDN